MAISLNAVNSEVVRAHKRIDELKTLGVSIWVQPRISILKIYNTVHLTVISNRTRRIDIPADMLPNVKVLGQGVAPVPRSGLNIACPSEFELSPDGSFRRVRNVENTEDTGDWCLVMFVYDL